MLAKKIQRKAQSKLHASNFPMWVGNFANSHLCEAPLKDHIKAPAKQASTSLNSLRGLHHLVPVLLRIRPYSKATFSIFQDQCSSVEVPDELPTIVGYSVLLAITLCMMLVIYNDHIFKDRPWVLYLLSGIIAFSIEVSMSTLQFCKREN